MTCKDFAAQMDTYRETEHLKITIIKLFDFILAGYLLSLEVAAVGKHFSQDIQITFMFKIL